MLGSGAKRAVPAPRWCVGQLVSLPQRTAGACGGTCGGRPTVIESVTNVGPGRLVIVGDEGGTNVGASLFRAAESLQIPVTMLNAAAAYDSPRLVARFNWWMRGRRRSRLRWFGGRVVASCREVRPQW